MKLPLLFKRVLFFLVFAVAVSSLPRILDYDKFFNVNVMSGMSHVNRQVYIYFINGLILAVLVVRLVYSEKRLKQFVWLTIIIGLVLALEGYLQYYGIMTVTPSEIDPTLTGEIRLTAFTGFSAGVTGERMLIPLFFSIAFSSVEKGRRRIFLLIIILIVLPAILLTYTRAVYLALGVGICLYLMLNFGTSAFRKVRKGILGAITVLMTGIGIAIINLGLIDHFQAHGRLSGKLFTGGDSLFVRVIRWILVMDAIKKQPIKGYGLGSSKEVLGMYATGELSNLYSSVHNFYLSWLIDTGIIGLVSLFLLYCYTLKNFNTVRNIAISTGEKDMFIYSNMFIAAFLGTSVVYIVNSDYVFDVFFLLFFALSFVLLRLSLPLKKQAISYSHKKEIIS